MSVAWPRGASRAATPRPGIGRARRPKIAPAEGRAAVAAVAAAGVGSGSGGCRGVACTGGGVVVERSQASGGCAVEAGRPAAAGGDRRGSRRCGRRDAGIRRAGETCGAGDRGGGGARIAGARGSGGTDAAGGRGDEPGRARGLRERTATGRARLRALQFLHGLGLGARRRSVSFGSQGLLGTGGSGGDPGRRDRRHRGGGGERGPGGCRARRSARLRRNARSRHTQPARTRHHPPHALPGRPHRMRLPLEPRRRRPRGHAGVAGKTRQRHRGWCDGLVAWGAWGA